MARLKKNPPGSALTQLLLPIQDFVKEESTSGILLILCAAAAMAWANSPWAGSYARFWETPLSIRAGSFHFSKPLLLWINDGLMAIFFFVVGLEIKREMIVGELSSFRKALLPMFAALGGMLFPAVIYMAFNHGTSGEPGWGIPMATDIAFAMGILSLLGKRVPFSMKIFLITVAIADDIGAVVVIAIFYTAEISFPFLAAAAVLLLLLAGINRLGIHHPAAYALPGIVLWMAFLKSGVHPTIAGVMLAMAIPARTRIDSEQFVSRNRSLLDEFERVGTRGTDIFTNAEQHGIMHAIEHSCHHVESPLQRLEHTLHPWVAYFIMPVFALANAGVSLAGEASRAAFHPVTLGVFAGLVLGKQLGITLSSWLLVRAGIAERPEGASWRHIWGVGWLGGIGFTMSLFINSLAFGDPHLLSVAKAGILAGSLVSGIAGWAILRKT